MYSVTRAMAPAWLIFEDFPSLGIGPGNYRYLCEEIIKPLQSAGASSHTMPLDLDCHNHPHNFYIQLFAETGIIGLIVGSIMFYSIFYHCFKNRKSKFDCPLTGISYIVPLALFFPLQQFGDFYGQWGNLFLWFSVGFALSNCQEKDTINN